jgi:enoyl-[acyl-carrier protein] reductase / trans-2-enoyl-CoA reductase (NAD+)
MIVKPKVRGFVCVTTHPAGCEAHVREEIEFVRKQGPIASGPQRVLVVGASTGYGLSSRIVPTYAWGAKTIGVFYERPSVENRPGTAGWYNSCFFKQIAQADGHYAVNVNGDAFSDAIKQKTADRIEQDWGQVDLIIYSLASPRRTDPKTGEVYNSVIRPIGDTLFTGKSIDTDKEEVIVASIEPATPEQVRQTVKVMGGEDWELWIDYLGRRGLLAPGFQTVAYSYIGPQQTWPVYRDGTIGMAKKDLERAAQSMNERYNSLQAKAFVSVNKAVVSQASAAIPVVPLYISIMLKVMEEKGVNESIVQQIDRLYRDHLFGKQLADPSKDFRIRIDDLELREDVQAEILKIWDRIDTGNLHTLSAFQGYKDEFLKLFGFGYDGVDYDAEVETHIVDPEVIE